MSADLAKARGIALGAPLALLGGAYVAQYVFGLPPCEMCWWQRYALFAALAFALLSLVRRDNKLLVSLAGLGILASGLIGGFHAGVEYGWWQGMTACTSNAAAGDDPLASVMANTAIVRCDVAPWTLAGISLAGFNFLISVSAALMLFAALRRATRP